MAHPDPDPDPDPDPETPLDCTRARELIARFLRGEEEDVSQRALLRAHSASCSGCNELYRAGVGLLASYAEQRRAPEAQAVSIKACAPPTSVLASARRRSSRFLLIGVGLLCAGALLAVAHDGELASARALAGRAELGELVLTPSGGAHTLARGDTLATPARSRVRLELGGSVVFVEELSALRIERTRTPRIFLYAGRILVEGRATIATALGVVECPHGALTLALEGGQMFVAASEDGASVREASGLRSLPAGESICLR